MIAITPFSVQTFPQQATQISYDVYIRNLIETTIYYSIHDADGALMYSANFPLTAQEFSTWSATMQSLTDIVLARLGLAEVVI